MQIYKSEHATAYMCTTVSEVIAAADWHNLTNNAVNNVLVVLIRGCNRSMDDLVLSTGIAFQARKFVHVN